MNQEFSLCPLLKLVLPETHNLRAAGAQPQAAVFSNGRRCTCREKNGERFAVSATARCSFDVAQRERRRNVRQRGRL
jgi:hypothetical protein